jgi:hypothetical protein
MKLSFYVPNLIIPLVFWSFSVILTAEEPSTSFKSWLKQCVPSHQADQLIEEKRDLQTSLKLETWAQLIPRLSLTHSRRAYIDSNAETITAGLMGNMANPFQIWTTLDSQYQKGQVQIEAAIDEKTEQEVSLIEAFFAWKASKSVFDIFSAGSHLLNHPALNGESELSGEDLDLYLTISNLIFIRDTAKQQLDFYNKFFSTCSSDSLTVDQIQFESVAIEDLEAAQKKVQAGSFQERTCSTHREYDRAKTLEKASLWTPSLFYSYNYPLRTTRNVTYDWSIGLQLAIPLGTLSADTSEHIVCELRATQQFRKLSQQVSEALAAFKTIRNLELISNKVESSLLAQTKVANQGLIHQTSFLSNLRRFYELQNQMARLHATIHGVIRRTEAL